MIKLKPCPLCASPAKAGRYALVFWHVKCTQCMLTLKDMHTSEEATATAWNTRLTEQDRRNASSKRRWKEAYYEIVERDSGEMVARWLAVTHEGEVNVGELLKNYGFNWDHYDRARDYGTCDSFSGALRKAVELRYYDTVY